MRVAPSRDEGAQSVFFRRRCCCCCCCCSSSSSSWSQCRRLHIYLYSMLWTIQRVRCCD